MNQRAREALIEKARLWESSRCQAGDVLPRVYAYYQGALDGLFEAAIQTADSELMKGLNLVHAHVEEEAAAEEVAR